MKTEEKKIFAEVISMYGTDEQMRVAQEECAELIQAISKYHRAQMSTDSRNKKHLVDRSTKNLIEELADVSIMVDQLKLIVKGNHTEVRAAKVKRISDRVNKDALGPKKPKKAKKPAKPAKEEETK